MTQKRFGYLPCDVVVDGVKESKCDEGSIRTQDLDGDGLILFILWIDRKCNSIVATSSVESLIRQREQSETEKDITCKSRRRSDLVAMQYYYVVLSKRPLFAK